MMNNTTAIIDIEAAYVKIGEHDVDFLKEVLKDLLDEIDDALQTTPALISEVNFGKIKNTFHRIKGSASMLCCENIRACCAALQQAGEQGTLVLQTNDGARITHQQNLIVELYNSFIAHTDVLKSYLQGQSLI